MLASEPVLPLDQPFRRLQRAAERDGKDRFGDEIYWLAGTKGAARRIIQVAAHENAAQPVAQVNFEPSIHEGNIRRMPGRQIDRLRSTRRNRTDLVTEVDNQCLQIDCDQRLILDY